MFWFILSCVKIIFIFVYFNFIVIIKLVVLVISVKNCFLLGEIEWIIELIFIFNYFYYWWENEWFLEGIKFRGRVFLEGNLVY